MKQELSSELQQEAASTKALLAAIPDDKLDWRPHPKSMSCGELGTHIATIPGRLIEMLSADGFRAEEIEGLGESLPSSQSMVEAFEEGVTKMAAELQSWDSTKEQALWQMTMADAPIMSMPRLQAVRGFIHNHLYHHRGQLSVYLRLLDVPVPSVYGPTADVNPFA